MSIRPFALSRRWFGMFAVVLLMTFVMLSAPVLAGLTDEEWAERKRTFEFEYSAAASNIELKIQAVRTHLDGVNHPDAVELLLRLQQQERASLEMQSVILNSLATQTDPACVDEIIKYADKARDGLKLQMFIALGRLAKDEAEGGTKAYEHLMASLDDRDKDVVVAACHGLTYSTRATALPKLCELFQHKKDEVRLASVRAVAALTNFERDCQTVMPPLLALAGDRKTKGQLRAEVYDALRRMTGYDLGEDAEQWASWWEQVKNEQNRDPKDVSGITVPRPRKVPTYYGIPIVDNKFVFVVDVSSSMEEPVSPAAKQQLKEKDDAAITPDPSIPENERPPQRRPLPWDKIHTKLDLAREEFIRAIEDLPEQCFFGLVTYSTEVTVEFDFTMLPASPSNKDRAIKLARSWNTFEFTNIYGALVEAFKFSISGGKQGSGGAVFTDGEPDEAPDAIFFLTDGYPTWSPDSKNLIDAQEGGRKGDGDHVNRDVIIRDIKELNAIQRVKIFTIGIGNHDRTLLIKLASDSGGEYRGVGVN